MTQLTGGAGYEVEVEGEAALAKQVLQNIAGVSLVESVPVNYPRENRAYLRVLSQPGSEPGKDIATTLIRAGFNLHEMRRVSATLEDVFLQLTTEEKNLATIDESAANEGEAA
jgi:ABC-2 type transport system ATP-binding protein